jgi:hypothetical protein
MVTGDLANEGIQQPYGHCGPTDIMNIIPIIISASIGLTGTLYYLQEIRDNPETINYRRGIMELEDAVDDLSRKPLVLTQINGVQQFGLPMRGAAELAHCSDINQQFLQRLPNGTQWDILVAGLDCDIATVTLAVPANSFSTLAKSLAASGITMVTTDHASNTVQWTRRLKPRATIDLAIKAQLQPNNLSSCYQCCITSGCLNNSGDNGNDESNQ